MAKPKVPLEQAVQAITDTFRTHGYEGASLARLSQASGLGKSSLYHHFPKGKDDMAKAARDLTVAQASEQFIGQLRADGDPRQRLDAARRGLEDFYAGGEKACLVNHFGVLEAAEAIPGAAQAMAEAMIAAFTKLAADAGAPMAEARDRGEQATADLEGALVLSRALGTSQPFFRMLGRLEQTLLS